MKVRLLCVGKTQSVELQNLINEYQKRLPPYIGFEIIEILEVKNAKNKSIIEIQKEELRHIEKHLKTNDTVVLLDEKGKEFTSRGFAKEIQKYQNQALQHLVFIVGGAYGFHPDIASFQPHKLALSKMTFTHQMIRLFFVEQLYRAFSILEGKPYHND